MTGLRCAGACCETPEVGAGGGGICCDVRLDTNSEDGRDVGAGRGLSARGEGGMELISGAIVGN